MDAAELEYRRTKAMLNADLDRHYRNIQRGLVIIMALAGVLFLATGCALILALAEAKPKPTAAADCPGWVSATTVNPTAAERAALVAQSGWIGPARGGC